MWQPPQSMFVTSEATSESEVPQRVARILAFHVLEYFSCLETDWWLEVRGDKWRELTQTVRQKQKKPWDSGAKHETDRRWWMRFRGDGQIQRADWLTTHSESQQSAPVWPGPVNVGQRKRDTFWRCSCSVDGGVTGNVTGNWVYFIYWASSTGTGLEYVQEEAGCCKTKIIAFTLT